MDTSVAEQLSYAMRNAEAREHFISFNAPQALLDWSFLAIEAIMLCGAVLALLHAIRHSRQLGNRSPLYTFAGIFLFGLVMDIGSYYTLVSFWHGEFSVMLVWNRLPLYIALLYPALLYHSYMTIRRYDFPPVTEAICTAFLTGTLYLIFDNLGPALNWWTWNRDVIYNQPFLNSVPLTSYHWMFLFSGALAYCLRKFAWDAMAAGQLRKAQIGVACMPLLTITLGCLLFIPYDVFLFVFHQPYIAALIHAVSFFAAGYWFLLAYRKPAARDNWLMFFPVLWIAGLLFLYIAKFDMLWSVNADGMNAKGLAVGNLLAASMAIITATAMILASHPQSPQQLPSTNEIKS